jgi:diketogulonate reductase-like aldo/keto reductase
MPTSVTLPGGESIPALGIGTWNMAVRRQKRADEIRALQMAVDLGMTVVDTAEMYGSGAAEELVGEALAHRRDDVFLVSKVLPQHATRTGVAAACEASLRRLKTERLDLYLLHWRGGVPLEHTLEGFNDLCRGGKIRYWGVSNFDADDMEELIGLDTGQGPHVTTNQVLYNLTRRGIEHDLLPWCQQHHVPVMAYSPLEQGSLSTHQAVRSIASRRRATPSQVALAWVLRQPDVMTIPKASHVDKVRENAGARELVLSAQDLEELDAAFPPPRRKKPLEMI